MFGSEAFPVGYLNSGMVVVSVSSGEVGLSEMLVMSCPEEGVGTALAIALWCVDGSTDVESAVLVLSMSGMLADFGSAVVVAGSWFLDTCAD